MARAIKPPQAKSATTKSKAKALVAKPRPAKGHVVRKSDSGTFKQKRVKSQQLKDALERKVVDIGAIQKAAVERRAVERLVHIDEMRDACRLHAAGQSQREIAETLRTTQPRVHRMLRAMEGRAAVDVTPEEVILRAVVDHSDRDALIRLLSKMTFTFGKPAPGGMDGGSTGSWDQVRLAVRNGLLSKDEFERVRAAVKPPKP